MMNIKFNLTLCIILLAFGVKAQQNAEKLLKNTNWIQEGYGRCLKIGDSTYTYYNINSLDCKTLAEGKLNGRFRIVSLSQNKLVLNPGGIVNYVFKKVDSLPALCRKPTTPITSYEENFKVFWETFNENYAFFKERNINWKQVYEEYQPKVKEIASPKGFADMLTEIVKKIGDGHIRLEIPDSLKTKIVRTAPRTNRTRKQLIKDIQDNYLVRTTTYNNGVISWGKLKGANIGYMMINDMNNFADYIPESQQHLPDFAKKYDKIKESRTPLLQFDEEHKGVDMIIEKIFSDLGQSDSMIIDLRFNGGGLETVALRFLSHFIGEKKYIIAIHAKTAEGNTAKQKYILQPAKPNYKGKISLLLSHNTASAAEIFTLAAKKYPNIKTMGSRTAGIFSEILWKELPNGWEFSLSNETYMDTKGKTYEGLGIPVNDEMNYPRNTPEFYNSFYSTDHFTDKALDKILNKR